MLNKILIWLCLIGATFISILSYILGAKNKENEILKKNAKLNKKYKHNYINSNSELFDKLHKNNF